MDSSPIPAIAAAVALVPLTFLAFRSVHQESAGPDPLFWMALVAAIFGPAQWALIQMTTGWPTGLAPALTVTVTTCLIAFALLCGLARSAWRLTRLLLPYLLVLSVLAAVAHARSHGHVANSPPLLWLDFHIVISLVTYALVTLAAVSALAGVIQERALKTKRPTWFSRALPPVAESEVLEIRLLALSEAVLGAGLMSGMALLYHETGAVLRFDHKTLLSVATFLVIGALLVARARSGVRGRAAARLALVAYLLLTLAYIGVKFVREILLTGAVGG
ncbi:MAG: cytochrome c biogenesis protein CcsA [Rhodospirillaceae bacterium]